MSKNHSRMKRNKLQARRNRVGSVVWNIFGNKYTIEDLRDLPPDIVITVNFSDEENFDIQNIK